MKENKHFLNKIRGEEYSGQGKTTGTAFFPLAHLPKNHTIRNVITPWERTEIEISTHPRNGSRGRMLTAKVSSVIQTGGIIIKGG